MNNQDTCYIEMDRLEELVEEKVKIYISHFCYDCNNRFFHRMACLCCRYCHSTNIVNGRIK